MSPLRRGRPLLEVVGWCILLSCSLRSPPPTSAAGFSLLTYNVKGNGATDWSTNAPQVRAIGRQLQYLQPDIITFNEIPNGLVYQMTNWVPAFLPGYSLATNSGTDGFIRSVIASRFPITRSRSWLTHANLTAFGYSGVFTRDLFEAQIAVPDFPQPLHVFTTHLKATAQGTAQTDTNRRGAEASAISNFLVTVYMTTNSLHPYVLTGDLNEDIDRPGTNYNSSQPIQRLISNPTGLRLTTPVNPFSASELTLSIQGILDVRFDYLLPCSLLFSNVASSQVFRTDLLPGPPPPLLASDDATASDHLPVLMVFNNPYEKPFRLLSANRTNSSVALTWEAVPGQPYQVETSSNLTTWIVLASNLTATGGLFTFTTNLAGDAQFFRVNRKP